MEATSSYLLEDGIAALAGSDTQLDSSDNGVSAKKPAWSKPSNGATAEAGAVMGAESWPALSESARASPKPSTDSPKAMSHGSLTVSQGMAVGSLSLQTEVDTIISTSNSTANHVAPTRQRSIKRGGGSSSQSSIPATGSLSQAPPTQGVVVEAPPPNQGKSSGSAGEFSKDNMHRVGGQRGGYSSFRRSSSGSQPRGDGSYHGGRRDQERGKQDWGNPSRSFGNREGHAPQQRGVNSRAYLRGPAPNAPFIPSPLPHVALRPPYATPMVYTEVSAPVYYGHPDSLRPMPMFPYSPMFFPMPDPQLPSKIVNQIDYYFSNENLVKDTFLRQNMDVEGWVSIKLIAGFKKVMQLTDNIQLILDAIQASNVVEVQGDKVRRKGDWNKWIMTHVHYTTVTSPPSQDMLAAHVNRITLDDKAAT